MEYFHDIRNSVILSKHNDIADDAMESFYAIFYSELQFTTMGCMLLLLYV